MEDNVASARETGCRIKGLGWGPSSSKVGVNAALESFCSIGFEDDAFIDGSS